MSSIFVPFLCSSVRFFRTIGVTTTVDQPRVDDSVTQKTPSAPKSQKIRRPASTKADSNLIDLDSASGSTNPNNDGKGKKSEWDDDAWSLLK